MLLKRDGILGGLWRKGLALPCGRAADALWLAPRGQRSLYKDGTIIVSFQAGSDQLKCLLSQTRRRVHLEPIPRARDSEGNLCWENGKTQQSKSWRPRPGLHLQGKAAKWALLLGLREKPFPPVKKPPSHQVKEPAPSEDVTAPPAPCFACFRLAGLFAPRGLQVRQPALPRLPGLLVWAQNVKHLLW